MTDTVDLYTEYILCNAHILHYNDKHANKESVSEEKFNKKNIIETCISGETEHDINVTCVGVCKEEKAGQPAEHITEGPVKLTNVVYDSARQRQSEQAVGECQVEQVNGCGVELLPLLADHIEDQAVAADADEEHQRVENGEDDHRSTLVHKHITVALVGRRTM